MVTTPSGGQVLLDKGYYQISGLAWSGRGKIRRVDVSVDGGRNWRTARLQGPVMDKCLTRFTHGLGVGRQAGADPEPRHGRDRLRAAHQPPAAHGARHAFDLSQQLDPDLARAGERRGEECPALVSASSPRSLALAAGAALAQTAAFHGIGRPATPKEVAAWDIDVRPDFKGLPKGSGSVAQGMDIWEAKCASCHGVFGESNEVFTPLVGGTTKDDVKTGRVARLTDPAYPGRTTLMKVATVSTLWDYIHRAMPWNAPKSLSTDEVYAVTAYLLNLGGVRARRLRAVRRQHRRGAAAAAQPQRHDHATTACGRARTSATAASPTSRPWPA